MLPVIGHLIGRFPLTPRHGFDRGSSFLCSLSIYLVFFLNNFVFASASRTPGLTMGDRINTRPRFYVFFLLFLPKKREIKNFYSFVVAAVVAVVAAVVVRFAHFRP